MLLHTVQKLYQRVVLTQVIGTEAEVLHPSPSYFTQTLAWFTEPHAPPILNCTLRSAFRGLSFGLVWLQCVFHVERQRAAAKVVPLTNHSRYNHCNKPIRRRNNLMWPGNVHVQVMVGFHWLKKRFELKKKMKPRSQRTLARLSPPKVWIPLAHAPTKVVSYKSRFS